MEMKLIMLTQKEIYDLQWFIGFSEGDGSWLVLDDDKKPVFYIGQKNPDLLFKIREILNFGEFRFDGRLYRLHVWKLEEIYQLILIFNGNLRLSKTQERFKLFLDAFNALKKINFSVKDKKEILFRPGPNLENIKFTADGWLSGLFDAEGCVTCSVQLNCSVLLDKKKKRQSVVSKRSSNPLYNFDSKG
jgi:hypothetical protein